jgi:DNA-binding NarL/FixJ family response regulator
MAARTPSGSSSKARIVLVEDHPILRHGIRVLIDDEPDLSVCGEAEDPAQAMVALATLEPDLVILDIRLKDTNGLDLIKEVRTKHPRLPILVLSMYKESLYAERALRAGARGYIMKQEATEKIMTAIRRVLAGEVYLSERTALQMAQKLVGGEHRSGEPSLEGLSDREFEVFTMIGQGMGPTEMAEKLGISVKTIETHREHIKEKLGLRTAAELVRCAVQHSLGEDVRLGDRQG